MKTKKLMVKIWLGYIGTLRRFSKIDRKQKDPVFLSFNLANKTP